ncbi:MAG TPA: DUF1801 domain-containing protein [Candidatus Dormibacteraeota bacterium]|jgi:hypothetical protein|nr:DUF1801 domain-containing protein [Candidatus Dormibacteraeota bacterium]
MKSDPAAEKWFAGKPAESILRRVREVILKADSRMSEGTKYGTVMFHSGGDFASFVQHNKPTVSLMFNRGGIIPGKYPHMEGEGRAVRFMRFANVKEVDARAPELGRIVVAWCDLMTAPKRAAPRKR